MSEKKKKILGVITARGGSKGIPGKNIKELDGKPLIAYTIEVAKKSHLISHLIVSTDDTEIAEIAKKYGADVPFLRPKELAEDKTPHVPVMQHAIEFMENKLGEEFDYVVILQPTSPFRIVEDIDKTIEKLIKTGADSAVSLVEVIDSHPSKIKKLEKDRVLPYSVEEVEGTRRQDMPVAYRRSSAVYTMRRNLIMNDNKLYGDHIVGHVVSKERSLDIDEPIDWIKAEYILKNLKAKGYEFFAEQDDTIQKDEVLNIPKGTNFKILNTIGKGFADEGKKILSQLGEVDYLVPDQDELNKIIDKYEIVVIGLGLNFDKEVIKMAKNLKIIITATTGLDHIDIIYAESKGIKVLSLKGEVEFLNSITGTAELAFGLMIKLLRLMSDAFDSVKNYQWDREKFRGHNIYGQTLGIIGLGRLGKWMAQYGKAFNMNVIYFDPNVDTDEYQKVSFDEFLSKSDVISIHTHLNDETENMFDADTFSKMKNNAYLINTSRGKIVNEKDLLEALKSKQIAGYGTDVLADELDFEDNFSNHPLVEHAKKNQNLIIVPHIGGMTHESRIATDVFISNKLRKYLSK